MIEASETPGLAILEEIGELPKSTQAKLLSFIERGYYYQLGTTKPSRLKKPLQIVGTTNKPRNAFRQDFYDRFFTFRIPDLYQRREDILYHLHGLNPDMIANLRPWEILILLSHHWPGNHRELERNTNAARIELSKTTSEKRLWDVLLKMPAKYDTLSLYDILSMEVIQSVLSESDKKWIEGILRKYGLSIDPGGITSPCLTTVKVENQDLPKKYPAILPKIKIFDTAYEGLTMFCSLFQQSIKGNFNLLKLSKDNRADSLLWPYTKTGIPEKNHERVDALRAIIGEYYEDRIELRYNGLTEDEVLTQYHKELLKQTKGNKAQAARKAGLPRTTYCDRLNQLRIK